MTDSTTRLRSLTRRELLQTATTALGMAALAPQAFAERPLYPAPTDPITPKVIVGTGSHRYECLHDWLMPPPDILWGDTHGVVEDSKGRIYVTHTVHANSPKKDAIVVFDKNGKFLTSWGDQFVGGGHGISVRKEGKEEFLYHCDIAHRKFCKTTLSGKVLWEKGAPEESGVYKKGEAFVPTNIAFSPNGDFYVADGYGSNWIHRYDLKGNYVSTFGGTGKEPGQFVTPHSIWLDNRNKDPLLVVADRENHRLQHLTLEGKPVKVYTDKMRRPCHFSIHNDLLLVPDLVSVVTLLDKDNRVVAQLGDGDPSNLRDKPRNQFIPGKFIHPHGGTFLKNGDILIAEWVPIGRMTRLRKLA